MKYRQLAEVVWLDAVAYDRASQDTEQKSPKDLLFPIKSYGYVLKQDTKAVVLAHEDSDDQKSFIVIPKKWIKSFKILGKAKASNVISNFAGAKAQRKSLRR